MKSIGFMEDGRFSEIGRVDGDEHTKQLHALVMKGMHKQQPGQETWIEVGEIDPKHYAERMARCPEAQPLVQYQMFRSMYAAIKHMGYGYNRVGMQSAVSKSRQEGKPWEVSLCGVTFRTYRED